MRLATREVACRGTTRVGLASTSLATISTIKDSTHNNVRNFVENIIAPCPLPASVHEVFQRRLATQQLVLGLVDLGSDESAPTLVGVVPDQQLSVPLLDAFLACTLPARAPSRPQRQSVSGWSPAHAAPLHDNTYSHSKLASDGEAPTAPQTEHGATTAERRWRQLTEHRG